MGSKLCPANGKKVTNISSSLGVGEWIESTTEMCVTITFPLEIIAEEFKFRLETFPACRWL